MKAGGIKAAAVVLGSNINALSIVSELKEKGVGPVLVLRKDSHLVGWSRQPDRQVKFDYSEPGELKKVLLKLRAKYEYLVLFPTADQDIELMRVIDKEIESFCFLPFNVKNVISSLDKTVQYLHCEKLRIPFPETLDIKKVEDVDGISKLKYPIIIKPTKNMGCKIDVFRNFLIKDENHLAEFRLKIVEPISEGVSFLASEIIPGNGNNIYAYVGYRSKKGVILNEWIGKKLAQFPDDFGVFSSGSNEAPEIVREQGRKLLEGMNLFGIAEPEFKYDHRDGKYKLMEVNLRSMMWHRVGNLSGVNLQYTQWLDALGMKTEKQRQELTRKIHFVYLQYEILNLLGRKSYWKTFRYNLLKGDEVFFAELQRKDIFPFLYTITITILRALKRCLKL